MSDKEDGILHVNDEIDLTSLLAVFLENFNFLLSILLVSIPVLAIYYLTSSEIYRTDSLIEIQNESRSFLPSSLDDPLGTKNNSLAAEIEIYKSNSTIVDALSRIKNNHNFDEQPSPEEVTSKRPSTSKSPARRTPSEPEMKSLGSTTRKCFVQ